jgi:hypothetical protein
VIQQAWTGETLPRSWTEGVLCRVYKKGDKLDCKNYRGTCLLNVTYKVFAKILYDSLLPHANAAVQHYQAGFQSGKSTTDQLFALLFIDFKAAYDTIIRNEVHIDVRAQFLYEINTSYQINTHYCNVLRQNTKRLFQTL